MRLRTYFVLAGFLCAGMLRGEDTSTGGGSAPGGSGAAAGANPSTGSGTPSDTSTGGNPSSAPNGGADSGSGTGTKPGSGTGKNGNDTSTPAGGNGAKPPAFGSGAGAPGSGTGAPGARAPGSLFQGDNGETTGTGANPTGAGTSFGAPNGGTTPSDTSAAPGAKPGLTAPSETFQSATGGSTTFGGGGVTAPAEALPTFTLPTAYGQAPQTFVPGAGRLSRPVFRYSASEQVGFNDNVLQAPTSPLNQSAVYQQVLVSRGIPEHTIVVENPPPAIPSLGLNPPPSFRSVVVPAVAPKFRRVLVRPAFHGQGRISSFVFRTSVGADVQFASKRTLFTFDLRLNGDEYTHRPGRPFDPNGSLVIGFVHKLTPRTEVSASGTLNYVSQPNTALLNVAPNTNSAYLDANARLNLSYRWTKRFSTVSSVTLDEIHYENSLQRFADNNTITLGTEARYLLSPRLTGVGEARYSIQQFTSNTAASNDTLTLLLGGDLALTSRFNGTLRVGEAIQSYTQSNVQNAAPYFEGSISWKYSPTGFASLNTRYGFENAGLANVNEKSFRTGLTVVQAFGKRLKASLGTTFVNLTTSGASTFDETSFQATIGMEYVMSPHLSFTGNASFIDVINSAPHTDYFQNQIFVGFAYTF